MVEKARKRAIEKNGKCHSTEYVNSATKMEWECEKGHKWETLLSLALRYWCKKCSSSKANESRKKTIEEMREIAKSHGGKCLSEKYVNANTPLLWECAEGHRWKGPSNNKKKSWCKRCRVKKAKDSVRLTMNDMHKLAISKSGECLSKTYVNSQTHLEWKCADGHVWKATPANIKKAWCPDCNIIGGLKEEKVRTILQQLLSIEFPKDRKQLGKRFELDGYNAEAKFAFEYHGEQHYYFIKAFYKIEENFKKRLKRDEKKLELCEEKGIYLLVVPYWVAKTDESLIAYIKQVLKEAKIEFNADKEVSASAGIYDGKLERLRKIAAERGGKCLSTVYKGSHGAHEFECAKGHRWKTAPTTIIHNKAWCGNCLPNKMLDIEEMRKMATALKGHCLSSEYINTKTKLWWKCEEEHVWESTPGNVRRGNWCKQCEKEKRKQKRAN